MEKKTNVHATPSRRKTKPTQATPWHAPAHEGRVVLEGGVEVKHLRLQQREDAALVGGVGVGVVFGVDIRGWGWLWLLLLSMGVGFEWAGGTAS